MLRVRFPPLPPGDCNSLDRSRLWEWFSVQPVGIARPRAPGSGEGAVATPQERLCNRADTGRPHRQHQVAGMKESMHRPTSRRSLVCLKLDSVASVGLVVGITLQLADFEV
ncbi:MAG: hypothetical protein KAV82_07370 [Phycisphaerae bacterium]|nr:hypothetical protein [Phycisphaerae bacterium]